jgi:divalent metal cation (Fe/Co/Zn/Cd) transporter
MNIHNLDLFQLQSGYLVNLDLELPSHLALAEATGYAEHLERAIRLELPEGSLVAIHLETRRDAPRPAVLNQLVEHQAREILRTLPEAESVADVRVFMVDQGTIINITCEFPPERLLPEAHAESHAIERKLRECMKGIVRVHITTRPANGQTIAAGSPGRTPQ